MTWSVETMWYIQLVMWVVIIIIMIVLPPLTSPHRSVKKHTLLSFFRTTMMKEMTNNSISTLFGFVLVVGVFPVLQAQNSPNML